MRAEVPQTLDVGLTAAYCVTCSKKTQLAPYHADKFSPPGKELREFVEACISLRVRRRSE